MTSQIAAKVWWLAPHEAYLERLVFTDQVVTFGRSATADIRIGHAPVYDEDVPRLWGELYWHRGRIHVGNVSDNWGFDLVSTRPADFGRVQVPPGASTSPRGREFVIEAQAPGAKHILHVLSAPRPINMGTRAGSDDPASHVAFTLTATQRLVGLAIIRPLRAGRGRRASYQEVADDTHYAMRTVRECVAAMDGLFVVHQLIEHDSSSDALDRVAVTLNRHPTLVH